MSYTIGVGCGNCSSNDETDGDCLCVDCTRGGMQCLPNNPDMITPQMTANMADDISITRGVPSQGAIDYGARGQKLDFENAVGAIAAQGAPTSNWSRRIDKLSPNALRNREGVLRNKLEKLQSRGSNSNWQQQLTDKISYIRGRLNSKGGASNFAGTPWQSDTRAGTAWQQTGVYSNWAGDSIPAPTPPPVILTQSSSGVEPETAGISATHIILSMLSVGVLFFVIGYSYEKGKKA